jgi:hypothetical protein
MSDPVIHKTSIEGYEVEIFVTITNISWVELDMNLVFSRRLISIFKFWILLPNGFLQSLVVNPQKTLITVRLIWETLYFASQDGHCL